MAEQLESLLQKLHDEAVSKADAAAQERLAAAEQQAADIVTTAERRAKDIVAGAERNAAQLVENGKKTLEQAARDLLIYLRQAIEAQFAVLIRGALPEVVPVSVIQEILVRLATDASREKRTAEGVRVAVSEDDYTNLIDFFMHRFRDQVQLGVELHPLRSIKAGFRIALKDKDVEYDFSDDVIVQMLCDLVNPTLQDILKKAVPARAQN